MNALITGGTSGIGYGVASQLAELGWNVTIVGRNAEKGVQIASGIGGTFIQADLSLMSEVQRLADQVEEPIDALVMCAGGVSMRSEPTVTHEGLETTFATNYLSKFVLSQFLLPRIMTHGSIVMVGGIGKTKNVSMEWAIQHSGFNAAFTSALAVDIYASLLASRNKNIRVHTCYPGWVRTNLLKEAAAPIRFLTRLFSSPIDQGSSYLTRLILEQHPEVHWKLVKPMLFSPPLPTGKNADQLWEFSQHTVSQILNLGRHDHAL